MKARIIVITLVALCLSGCVTDPRTGETHISQDAVAVGTGSAVGHIIGAALVNAL